MLFLDHDIIFYFLTTLKKFKKHLSLVLYTLEILCKIEHLLIKSKFPIFHNIFKNMIFQRCQSAFFKWSKWLNGVT